MYDRDNDISRIFREDSRDKKRTAVGIHNRASRRGYIRGGIRTQSDFLTAKQKRLLSGEVRTYSMYDKYKDLKNCKLDEILSKDDNEIKAILTMIKANNSSSKVQKAFGISSGKLYGYYTKYEVPIEKRASQLKPSDDILKKLITVNKFKLMDSIGKGEYMYNFMDKHNVAVNVLAEHWNINKNTLAHYLMLYRRKKAKDTPIAKDLPRAEQMIIAENSTLRPAEKVQEDKINDVQSELDKAIEDLRIAQEENKKLVARLLEISLNETTSNSKFRIELNGEYSKEDLGNRLLSLDNLTLEPNTYRIKLTLEEV